MWLIKKTAPRPRLSGAGSLFIDLYELTMAQVYFKKQMNDTASFEVSVRRLPEDWGFFVMAGLAELKSYLEEFGFSKDDIKYLQSTGMFARDFLEFLGSFRPDVKIRCLPEGTVFFASEPILEVTGPLICAQVLESYCLNILGFSIIQATLAARVRIAAEAAAVVDFGLRRCQGPVASLRSARAAQMAGFAATSNVFAARELNFTPSGTMAHSFVEVHESEEKSFQNYAEAYGERAILLVDTYDTVEGIKKAAQVARRFLKEKGVKIRGIRIDSGDLVELSGFARRHFEKEGVQFLKIFVSGDLDEFKIAGLLKAGAEIDGIGIGTRFGVSRFAPAIEIVYKIVEFAGKGLFKTSPDKPSRPGRKTIIRARDRYYKKDIVCGLESRPAGLLKPFELPEDIETIKTRLEAELSCLDDSIKAIRKPAKYPVEFAW